MKKIVKIFVLIIALTMATNGLFAQTFGVKGGLNLSNHKQNYDIYDGRLKMKSGFQIGATVEFPISEMFSFETGLLFSTKGSKMIMPSSIWNPDYNVESISNLIYIDIPLTAKARYDLGGAKIFVIAGPYIGIGVGGKYKFEKKANNGEKIFSKETDIKWGESGYKRLDFGLTIGPGVEINSIQIGLIYSLSLTNIIFSDDYKVYNQVLGISLGYRF